MSNFLPLGVRSVLSKTGWTENEVAIYSTLLSKGAMDLSTLSHETSIGVSTIQYSLKQLIVKKMVQKTLLNNKPLYAISDIESLRKWLKGYLKQFTVYEETIQKFVDQYDFNPKIFLSKARFFEGYRGVKQSYRTMLKECRGNEIMGFFSVIENVGKELQDFFVQEYVPDRVQKGIFIKNIALESPKAIAYQRNDNEELRQTKLISKEFFPMINTEINLYDDCLHCMSFNSKTAFALIIQDEAIVSILRAIFKLLWMHRDALYMTDYPEVLEETMQSRRELYVPDFRRKFIAAEPKIEKTKEGETVMRVLGHEVMSTYQVPYMHTLAEIVTRNGGNILNVGYGLGLLDEEIEKYRKPRKLGTHTVVEINSHIAAEARKKKELIVIERDWHDALNDFRGVQFDGIVYDGYPLSLEEVHRDGVMFIERIVERNLLKPDGILTFFVDAADHLGDRFLGLLRKLGFNRIEVKKIPIDVPDRERQVWRHDHFLAPMVQYGKT